MGVSYSFSPNCVRVSRCREGGAGASSLVWKWKERQVSLLNEIGGAQNPWSRFEIDIRDLRLMGFYFLSSPFAKVKLPHQAIDVPLVDANEPLLEPEQVIAEFRRYWREIGEPKPITLSRNGFSIAKLRLKTSPPDSPVVLDCADHGPLTLDYHVWGELFAFLFRDVKAQQDSMMLPGLVTRTSDHWTISGLKPEAPERLPAGFLFRPLDRAKRLVDPVIRTLMELNRALEEHQRIPDHNSFLQAVLRKLTDGVRSRSFDPALHTALRDLDQFRAMCKQEDELLEEARKRASELDAFKQDIAEREKDFLARQRRLSTQERESESKKAEVQAEQKRLESLIRDSDLLEAALRQREEALAKALDMEFLSKLEFAATELQAALLEESSDKEQLAKLCECSLALLTLILDEPAVDTLARIAKAKSEAEELQTLAEAEIANAEQLLTEHRRQIALESEKLSEREADLSRRETELKSARLALDYRAQQLGSGSKKGK